MLFRTPYLEAVAWFEADAARWAERDRQAHDAERACRDDDAGQADDPAP